MHAEVFFESMLLKKQSLKNKQTKQKKLCLSLLYLEALLYRQSFALSTFLSPPAPANSRLEPSMVKNQGLFGGSVGWLGLQDDLWAHCA